MLLLAESLKYLVSCFGDFQTHHNFWFLLLLLNIDYSKTPFTRYKPLYNWLVQQENACIHDTASCQTSCYNRLYEFNMFDSCNPTSDHSHCVYKLTTGCTTGCVVYMQLYSCSCSRNSNNVLSNIHIYTVKWYIRQWNSTLTLLVGRQEGHPACKNWVVGCWHGYVAGSRCRFA